MATAFGAIDAFLVSASRACCSPFAVFVQIQGCFICLMLALGWGLAAYVRNREIRRITDKFKCGNSFAFLYQDINDLEHYSQKKLPRVSVVMPLKGFGEHNLQNWRTQIISLYGGPVEFLFVVESTEDPAYHAVCMLISDIQVNWESCAHFQIKQGLNGIFVNNCRKASRHRYFQQIQLPGIKAQLSGIIAQLSGHSHVFRDFIAFLGHLHWFRGFIGSPGLGPRHKTPARLLYI